MIFKLILKIKLRDYQSIKKIPYKAIFLFWSIILCVFLIDNQNRNRSGPSQIELRSAVEMMRSISTFINNNNSKKETSLPNYYKQIIQSQCHSVSATVEINVSQSQSHRGQREAFFQPREENENFSYTILHMETRREFLEFQTSRRDREKFSF